MPALSLCFSGNPSPCLPLIAFAFIKLCCSLPNKTTKQSANQQQQCSQFVRKCTQVRGGGEGGRRTAWRVRSGEKQSHTHGTEQQHAPRSQPNKQDAQLRARSSLMPLLPGALEATIATDVRAHPVGANSAEWHKGGESVVVHTHRERGGRGGGRQRETERQRDRERGGHAQTHSCTDTRTYHAALVTKIAPEFALVLLCIGSCCWPFLRCNECA